MGPPGTGGVVVVLSVCLLIALTADHRNLNSAKVPDVRNINE
jgi:hypothetical protein